MFGAQPADATNYRQTLIVDRVRYLQHAFTIIQALCVENKRQKQVFAAALQEIIQVCQELIETPLFGAIIKPAFFEVHVV